MKKELVVECNLYIDMLPDETKEDAEERLYCLLVDNNIECSVWSTEEREK